MARARDWRWRQHSGGVGSTVAAVAAQRQRWRRRGDAAATIDNRLTTEEDEAIATPPGLRCGNRHNTNNN